MSFISNTFDDDDNTNNQIFNDYNNTLFSINHSLDNDDIFNQQQQNPKQQQEELILHVVSSSSREETKNLNKRGRPKIIDGLSHLNKKNNIEQQQQLELVPSSSITSSLITKSDDNNGMFDIQNNVKADITAEDMRGVYNRICVKPEKKRKREDDDINLYYDDEESNKKKQKNKKHNNHHRSSSLPYTNMPNLKLPNSIKKIIKKPSSSSSTTTNDDIDSRNSINFAKRVHSIKKHINQTANIDDKYKMWFISKSIVSNKYSMIVPSLPKDDEDLDKCFNNSQLFLKYFQNDLEKISTLKNTSDDYVVKMKHLSIIMADAFSKLTPENISLEVEDSANMVYSDVTRILDCSRSKYLDSGIQTAYTNKIIDGYKKKEVVPPLLKNNNYQSTQTLPREQHINNSTSITIDQMIVNERSTDFFKTDDDFNDNMWENQMTNNELITINDDIGKVIVSPTSKEKIINDLFVDIPTSPVIQKTPTTPNISSPPPVFKTTVSLLEEYENLLKSTDIHSNYGASKFKDIDINIQQIITTNTKISITDKKTGAILISDKNKMSQFKNTFVTNI